MTDTAQGAPRKLGGMMTLLGLVLAAGGAQLNLSTGGGGSYHLVLGLAVAASGILVFLGRRLALYAYAAALMIAWIWSLAELSGDLGQAFAQVFLPTLLGLYLFSPQVRGRLT